MHRKLLHTGKTRGKKKTYLAITAVMLLMLATAAVLLLHQATERRAEEYTRKARESYSAGDYENALLYLRRIKDEDRNTEILLLTADCYEALENYPRALETLRKLNTADPAISNRIQSIEQRKLPPPDDGFVDVALSHIASVVKEPTPYSHYVNARRQPSEAHTTACPSRRRRL